MKDTYTLDVELNIEDSLKQLRELKEEVKSTTNEIEFDLKKLRLRRKDILVVRLNGMFEANDKMKIEKQLLKKLHRKVLVIDDSINLFSIEK